MAQGRDLGFASVAFASSGHFNGENVVENDEETEETMSFLG